MGGRRRIAWFRESGGGGVGWKVEIRGRRDRRLEGGDMEESVNDSYVEMEDLDLSRGVGRGVDEGGGDRVKI